jgi:phospholipase A1
MEAPRTYLEAHKTNYLLFYSYDNEAHPERDVMSEAMYQISIKIPLHYDSYDLFFAYTQKAFWQVYDNDDTRPFREIDHAPELFFETNGTMIPSARAEKFRFGYEHESNGEGLKTTRAWNRLFGTAYYRMGDLDLEVKLWYWLKKRPKESPTDPDGDETPGIRNYYGNGELRGVYHYGEYRFSAMARNTLETEGSRGAVELSVQGPMNNVDWYLLYWRGYGESVGMYDALSERIGFGIAFTR